MKEKLELLKTMMSPDYDWEAHWERDELDRGIDDIFRQCYRWHDYRQGNRLKPTHGCGSVKFTDTPKALYRILYLVKPSFVDFSDMYKTGTLIDLTDPEQRFLCSFQLCKYEASMWFSCPKEFLVDDQEGQGFRISCGVPGVDDGTRCSDPLGNLFFEVATMALNFQHMVYGGNDFSV